MKILCNFTPCGPSYVRSGWGRVFQALGHQFLFWNPNSKPAFDVFEEFEPDIYLGTTYECDRAVVKNIVSRPHMKVGLYASAWGPYLKNVDLKKYPIVVTSEQERQTIEALKKATGKPDFVFIHAHDKWLEGTMSGWGELGIPYLGVLNAADMFIYYNTKPQPELACDIGFVGGYWPYKARNINKYLMPLLHPTSGLKAKIFGNQPWPCHQYMGGIEDQDAASLFVSAAVCPNVSEPHSTDLGWDLIERPMKVLSSGGLCVSDYVDEGRAIFAEDELPMARNPKEFAELIRNYVKNPEQGLAIRTKGQQKVLSAHTYHHRVAQMFTQFGMTNEAARCLQHLELLIANKTTGRV